MRKLEKKKTRDGFDSDICIDIFETGVFHIVFESSIHEKASMVAISIVYHRDCINHINLSPFTEGNDQANVPNGSIDISGLLPRKRSNKEVFRHCKR